MFSIHGDVFTGTLIKSFEAEKGFKGVMELPDEQKIGVLVDYDGKMKEYLAENIGKKVVLVGNLIIGEKIPILIVREKLNGGGLVVKRGRVARDPELKYSPEGKPYTVFSIAVNRGFGDKKETYFYNCVIFGNEKEKNAAINFAEKIAKGQEVIVKGRLSTNKGKEKEKIFYNLIISDYELIFNKKSDNSNEKVEQQPDFGISLEDIEISMGNIQKDNDPYQEYVNLDDIQITGDDDEIPF